MDYNGLGWFCLLHDMRAQFTRHVTVCATCVP